MIARQGFRTQKGALPLLGTVVGNDDKVIQQLVNDKVDGWKKALELLAHEEIPAQLALLVGRWIMTAKPNSLARSLPHYHHSPFERLWRGCAHHDAKEAAPYASG